jgi:hypothetical protein
MTVSGAASTGAAARLRAGEKYAGDVFAGLFAGLGAAVAGLLSTFATDWEWLPPAMASLLVCVASRATWRESRTFGVTTLLAGMVGLFLVMTMLSGAVLTAG